MRIRQEAPPQANPILVAAWRHFRHELLYVCWALMDLALIAPVAIAAMPWAPYWPPGQLSLWMLFLMGLPFNLSRLMSLLKVPVNHQQTALAAGLLLALLLALRNLLYVTASPFDLSWISTFYRHVAESGNPYWSRDVTVFILVVVLWWRGTSLVGRRLDIKSVGLRLRLGALVFAPLAITVAAGLLEWNVVPFVLLFFFASLLAVALTRAEQLEQDKSGMAFPMSPRWLAMVLLSATFIVLAAALFAGLISGQPVLGLVGWLAPVVLALHFAAATVFGIVTYLALPLLALFGVLLEWLIRMLTPALERAMSQLPTPNEGLPVTATPVLDEMSRITQQSRTWLVLLGMLLVVLLVALALGRLYQRMRPEAMEDSHQAGGRSRAPGDERPGWAGRLWRQLGLWSGWRAAASVRRIYRDMCLLAASAGYPRAGPETPFEYLATLAKAWPDQTADTHLITRAFVRVRYGEYPEKAEELNEIRAAWKRLEQSLPQGIQG